MAQRRTVANLLSVGRKPDRKERRATYFGKVSLEETYTELVGKLRWSQKEISQFIEPLMDTCLEKSEEVFAADVAADADRLKLQLHSALLSAMQDIKSLKSADTDDGEQLVFFEPLKHLDDTTKHLVLELVVDKVTQVINGKLSLESLRNSMAQLANDAAPARPRVRGSILARNSELDTMRLQTKAAVASEQVEEATERADHAEKLAQDATNVLKDRTQKMQREIDALRQDLADLADVRSQLSFVEGRLLDANKRRKEMEVSLQDVNALVEELAKNCKNAEARYQNAEARCQEAELQDKEVEPRAVRCQDAETQCEALVGSNTAAKLHVGIQTFGGDRIESHQIEAMSLDGAPKTDMPDFLNEPEHIAREEIEHLALENQQLKMMLKESQAKLKDFIEQCKQSQMKEGSLSEIVTSLMADVGLDPFSKDRHVFQRLYHDAVNRVSRLQDLQDKHREKHVQGEKHTSPGRKAMSDHRFIIPQKGSMVNKAFIMRRGRQAYSLGRQHHKFELEQL